MRLSEERLAELEALAGNATPGPWFVSGVRSKLAGSAYHQVNRYDEAKKADENIAAVGYDERTGIGFKDAHFIAGANPETVAALISEIRELRADSAHIEWLTMQHVEVRTPLRYGSAANFVTSPEQDDDIDHPSDLRKRIDAALSTPSLENKGDAS